MLIVEPKIRTFLARTAPGLLVVTLGYWLGSLLFGEPTIADLAEATIWIAGSYAVIFVAYALRKVLKRKDKEASD